MNKLESRHLDVVKSITQESELLEFFKNVRTLVQDQRLDENQLLLNEYSAHLLGAAAVAWLSPYKLNFDVDYLGTLVRSGNIFGKDFNTLPFVGQTIPVDDILSIKALIGPNEELPGSPLLLIRKEAVVTGDGENGVRTEFRRGDPTEFALPMVRDKADSWYSNGPSSVTAMEAAVRLVSMANWLPLEPYVTRWPR